MFRNLLIKAALNDQNSDLSEVYTYAAQFNITPQQVNAVLSDKPSQIREKLIAWKYLIHSLFDTGYTPWIKGDGVAYFIVPIKPNVDSYAEVVIKVGGFQGTQLLLGSRIDTANNNYASRYTVCINGSDIRYDWVNGSQSKYTYNFINKKTKVKTSRGYIAINDETVVNIPNVVKTLPDVDFAVFTCNNSDGVTTSFLYQSFLNRAIITGNVAPNTPGSVNLVPYLDNGEYGMLDLITGTFYGSAVQNGLFSYTLEDANGNKVNIN